MVAIRRGSATRLAAAALASRWLGTSPAAAWCGDPYPPYAYTLPWFEFDAGSKELPVAMRIVGDNRPEAKRALSPLLVLPSPTLSYEYLETLEALTISERRVAFATLTLPSSEDEADFYGLLAKQAATAIARLEVPRAHVLGHGLGAAVALALYRAQPQRVASLVLASPLGSLEDAATASRDDLAASARPLLGLSSAMKGRTCVSAEVGRLQKGASRASRLQEALAGTLPSLSKASGDGLLSQVACPLLVTRGADDVSSDATAQRVLQQVDGARLATFADAASLPHIEAKAKYNEALLAFFDEVDGVRTRRAAINDAQFPS